MKFPSTSIELQFYKPEYLEALQSYQLPEDQEQYTALPIHRLDKSEDQHPIVIAADNKPVGFFVLHEHAHIHEYTTNPHALMLTAFSIDHAKQGQGYATTGLELLKRFVPQHFPGFNEIVLAVNHKNISAQKLYMKVGFVDTGQRHIGMIGEQFILRLSL